MAVKEIQHMLFLSSQMYAISVHTKKNCVSKVTIRRYMSVSCITTRDKIQFRKPCSRVIMWLLHKIVMIQILDGNKVSSNSVTDCCADKTTVMCFADLPTECIHLQWRCERGAVQFPMELTWSSALFPFWIHKCHQNIIPIKMVLMLTQDFPLYL